MSIFNIKVQAVTTKLGTVTRKASKGVSSVPDLPMVDGEGKPLVGVNPQTPIIKVKGGVAKHLGAFYKNNIAGSVINEFSGKTGTDLGMLMPSEDIKDFKMEDLSEDVLASEKDGKIVNFNWKEVDANGKVTAEAKCTDVVSKKSGESKRMWHKHFYNAPIYYQRMTLRGEDIKQEFHGKVRKQVKKDAKGTYIETFNKYTHIAPFAVGLYPGQKLTDAGTLIDKTRGIYLVVTARGTEGSVMPDPRKTSTKFSIAGMIHKVLAHPTFGIMSSEHINDKGGVVEGKIKVEVKSSKIRLFDVDGNPADIVEGYRLESFRAKRSLKPSTVEDAVVEKEDIKAGLSSITESTAATTTATDEDEEGLF